jgi:hypothetical protein
MASGRTGWHRCKRGVLDGDTEHGEGFDLREARLPDFYPADDVLAEMG